MPFPNQKITHLIHPAALVLFLSSLFAFRSVFSAGYVTWDDPVLILNNPILKLPFSEAVQFAFSRFYHGDFLPLPLLSYWIEVSFFGLNPLPAHVLNLVLHLGCGLLLWSFLRSLQLNERARFFICGVFLLHPLQVESVLWLSERKGLISAFCLLFAANASFKVNLQPFKWSRDHVFYVLFFVLSLLSKLTGVALPFLLLWFDFKKAKQNPSLIGKEIFKKHTVPILVGCAMAAIRIAAYSYGLKGFGSISMDSTRVLHLPFMIAAAFGFYIRSFFLPVDLAAIYPRYSFDAAWMGYGLIGLGAAVSVILLNRKLKSVSLEFFSYFTVCFLLPILQIVPRINFVNDRYLYLPIIGILGICVSAMERVKLARNPVFGIGGILCLFFAMTVASSYRSEVWIDDLSLWKDTGLKAPWSGIAQNNLALAYVDKGAIQEAIPHYEEGIKVGVQDGTDMLSYNGLGNLYFSSSDYSKAAELYLKGIQRSTRPFDTFEMRFNLALAYLKLKQFDKAIEFTESLEKDLVSNKTEGKYLPLLEETKRLQTNLKSLRPVAQ